MTRYMPLWLQQGTYPASVDRRLAKAIWPRDTVYGFELTRLPGTMSVIIGPGWMAKDVASGAVLCASDANETVPFVPAPGTGQSMLQVVYARPRGTDIDGGPDNDWVFGVAAGTPAVGGAPPPPTIPPNSLALYAVTVPGGVTSLDSAAVTVSDQRPTEEALAVHKAVVTRAQIAGPFNIGTTPGIVPLASVGFDSPGAFNPGLCVYTCPWGGRYRVFGSVASSDPSVILGAFIYRNGAQNSNGGPSGRSTAAGGTIAQVQDIVGCNRGDTMALYASASAPVAGVVDGRQTFLTVELVH